MINVDKYNTKVRTNFVFRFFYRAWVYFDIGKTQIARITNPFDDIAAALIILVMGFGVDLTQYRTLFWSIVGIGLFSLVFLGILYIKLGFYNLERHALTNIDPVMLEIYNAAKKINGTEDAIGGRELDKVTK